MTHKMLINIGCLSALARSISSLHTIIIFCTSPGKIQDNSFIQLNGSLT